MESFAQNGFRAIAIAAGYFAGAVIGTVLSVPPSGFAIIWPATAFLIAVLMLLPPRQWWLCAAGVIPTHYALAALFQSSAPLVVVTTQVAGNLLVAGTTVAVVRAAIGRTPAFDGFRPMLGFILIAGVAVPAIVNPLIIGVHLATGWTSDFWLSWRQWMIAGIFPTVTIPPLIVLAARTRPGVWTAAAIVEPVLLIALLFGLGYVLFGDAADAAGWPALFLMPLPLLLWAAVRLGVGGTSAALLALAAAIIVRALGREGPFGAHSPIEDVVSLQVFLTTISIPLLLLAALVDERRRTAELLRQSEARMQLVAAGIDIGLWQWDEEAQRLWLTDHCRAMFDLPEIATPFAFLDAVHPEDRARVGDALSSALTGDGKPLAEFRIGPDDAARWFGLLLHTEFDKAGKPVRVSGVFRDVSERVNALLETERLRQQLLRLQDDEQRRIAEELHDSTAQHLVAASLNLMSLKGGAPAGPLHLVEETQRLIGEVTAEIRTFSFLLHPQQLGEDGLATLLEEYVPGFARRTGIRSDLRVNPIVDRLPDEQQHALLRIAQESLGNVHRHAGAKRVSVDLRCIGGNVHLVVRDDGHGIRPETGRRLGERLQLGVGIPAMTARVRQLGGRIDVNTRRTGTTIHVAIPFHEERSEAA